MFVKFGDKTKALNVKKGKRSGDPDASTVYTDDEEDRRSKALKKSLDKEDNEEREDSQP